MKLQVALLLIVLSLCACGQNKYDANWCFGIKAGVNFNDTAHPINFNTLSNANGSGACISDSLGNLIFYVAPDTPFSMAGIEYESNAIYDNTNKIILNGDSIDVGIGYFDGLILPISGYKDSYIFFYEQWIDSFNDINDIDYNFVNLIFCEVSRIDSNYIVTNKNQVLSNIPTEFKIAAVKDASGNGWWLLVHQSDETVAKDSTNTFIEYLIRGDTILGPYRQSIGSFHNSYYSIAGQLVFSPDGNWLACSLADENAVDIFNFDRCTGQLKNYIPIRNIDATGIGQMAGSAFSANNQKLYISEGLGNITNRSALYQYSLDSPNIESSKIVIWQTNDSATTFGELSLAPDNKIYLAVEHDALSPYPYEDYNIDNQYLWVVESPDSSGMACNFQPYGYYLGDSARVYYGLVNAPNYNLGPLSIYQAGAGIDTTICGTDTNTILIGLPPVAGVTNSWQSAAGIADTTQAQQLVKPSQSTWYYVTLTDTTIQYSCQSRTDSVYVGVKDCTSGIQNIDEPVEKIIVYPNPAKDVVYIITLLAGNENGILEVLDVDGQKIDELAIKGGNSSYTLSTASFADGVYLYHLKTNQQYEAHGKLVIAH